MPIEQLFSAGANSVETALLDHEVTAGPAVKIPNSSAACLRQTQCPACGHCVAGPFYNGGEKPLAMIAWPGSAAEAAQLPKLPLDYVSCLDCGHIYNAAFSYDAVPYVSKPNLMYNRGLIWNGFLQQLRAKVLGFLPENATVIEIGHGDGHFLAGLASERPGGRYIGFDPHGLKDVPHPSVELRATLFDPFVHVPELRPDLIVSRHVLEHLTNPLGLLQGIDTSAGWCQKPIRLLLEVPCVDRAVEHRRLNDFYYEHFSQFTTKSFHRMLVKAHLEVDGLEHAYNGEVVYAFPATSQRLDHLLRFDSAVRFQNDAKKSSANVARQIDQLHACGRRVAIWGGVGKCAAFLNTYGLDARRFPLVVDSDSGKAGTYVPGTGQEIQHCSVLLEKKVDTILIAAQWRSRDIAREISSMNLNCEILLEHDGKLVHYQSGAHPYRQ